MDLLSDDDSSADVGASPGSSTVTKLNSTMRSGSNGISNTKGSKDDDASKAVILSKRLNNPPLEADNTDTNDPLDESLRALDAIALQAYLLKRRREPSPAGRKSGEDDEDSEDMHQNHKYTESEGGISKVDPKESKSADTSYLGITPSKLLNRSRADTPMTASRKAGSSFSAVNKQPLSPSSGRIDKLLSNANEISRLLTPIRPGVSSISANNDLLSSAESHVNHSISSAGTDDGDLFVDDLGSDLNKFTMKSASRSPKEREMGGGAVVSTDSSNDWLQEVINKSLVAKKKYADMLEEKEGVIAQLERQLAEAHSRNIDLMLKIKNRKRLQACGIFYRCISLRVIGALNGSFARWRSLIYALKYTDMDKCKSTWKEEQMNWTLAKEEYRYSTNLQGASMTLRVIRNFWKKRLVKAWNLWKTGSLVKSTSDFTSEKFAVRHLCLYHKRKAFKSWRDNVSLELRLKRIAYKATKNRDVRLMKRSFANWKDALLLSKYRKKALSGVFGAMKRQSKVSTCFAKWRFLSTCVVPQRIQALRAVIKGRESYSAKVSRHFFYRWRDICSQQKSHSCALESLSDRRERRVKRALWSGWNKYNREQKRFKQGIIRIMSIDNRHYRNALLLAYHKWVKFSMSNIVNSLMGELAVVSQRAEVVQRALSEAPSKRLTATIPITRGMLLRSILVRFTQYRLSVCLSTWRCNAIRMTRSQQQISSKRKVCNRLVSRFQRLIYAKIAYAFKTWAQRTTRHSTIERRLVHLTRISTTSILRHFIRRWQGTVIKYRDLDRQKSSQVKAIRHLLLNKEIKRVRNLSVRLWLRWKTDNEECKKRRNRFKMVLSRMSRHRINSAFNTWRQNTDNIRNASILTRSDAIHRDKTRLAAFTMMKRLLATPMWYYFDIWRESAAAKKTMRSVIVRLYEVATVCQQRDAFLQWKTACVKYEAGKKKLAVVLRLLQHQHRLVTLMAWKRWQVFYHMKVRYVELVKFLGEQVQSNEAAANRQTVLSRFNSWKFASFRRRIVSKSQSHGATRLMKIFDSLLKRESFHIWLGRVRSQASISTGLTRLFICIEDNAVARHFMTWKTISREEIIRNTFLDALTINFARKERHRNMHRTLRDWIEYNRRTKRSLQHFGEKLLLVRRTRSQRLGFSRWRRLITENLKLDRFANVFNRKIKLLAFRKFKFHCKIAHSVLNKLSAFFSVYSKHRIRVFWLRWRAEMKLSSISSKFIEQLIRVQKRAELYNIRSAFFRLKNWSACVQGRTTSLLHIMSSTSRRNRRSVLRRAVTKWKQVVQSSALFTAARHEMHAAQKAIDILHNITPNCFLDPSEKSGGDTAKELLTCASESFASLAPNLLVADIQYWDAIAGRMISCRDVISMHRDETDKEPRIQPSLSSIGVLNMPSQPVGENLYLQTTFPSPLSVNRSRNSNPTSPDGRVDSTTPKYPSSGLLRQSPQMSVRRTESRGDISSRSNGGGEFSPSSSRNFRRSPSPSRIITTPLPQSKQSSPSIMRQVNAVIHDINPLLHEMLHVDAIKAIEVSDIIVRLVDSSVMANKLSAAEGFNDTYGGEMDSSPREEVGLLSIPLLHRGECIGLLQLLVNTAAELLLFQSSNHLYLISDLLASKPSLPLQSLTNHHRTNFVAAAMEYISLPPTIIPAFGALLVLLTNTIYDQVVVAQPIYEDMKNQQSLMASTQLSTVNAMTQEFSSERSALESEISVARTKQNKLSKKCEKYKELAQSWKDYSDTKEKEMRALKKELRLLRERQKDVERLHSVMKRVSQMALDD